MNITKKEIEPPPPRHRVVIEMSQEEAGLLHHILNYYAARSPAVAPARVSAARFRDSLKEYSGKQVFPYESYFA